ncbi:MAG: ABC transporter substrate-binding protein [Candidatus Bathyarchaeia archaeon]
MARDETLIIDFLGGRVPAPYDCWNMLVSGNERRNGYHQLLYESLIYHNPFTGETIPWLAESWEYNENYTKLTVHLRQGIKWNDGEPFTADDPVFTYQLLLQYAPKLLYSAQVSSWVESVEKIDAYTFRINLKKPNPRFHYLDQAFPTALMWGGLPVVPKHIWEGQDPLTFKNYPPVTTGPYRIVSVSETIFIYERRDDWWATELFHVRPAPKRVIFTRYGTMDVQCMRMAAHDIDAIWNVLYGTFSELKKSTPSVIAYSYNPPYGAPDFGLKYLFLNHEKYPFNMSEVRRAIGYLIDRDMLISVALENTVKQLTGGLLMAYGESKPYVESQEYKALLDKYKPLEYNPTKAREIFLSLGFRLGSDNIWILPNGQRWTVDFVVRAWDTDLITIGPLIADMLREAGIDVSWRSVLSAAHGTILPTGDWDIITGVISGVLNPPLVFDNFHSRYYVPLGSKASSNYVRYKNAEWDHLTDEFAITPPTEIAKCTELFVKLMDIFYRDYIIVPLHEPYYIIAFDTYYWKGWPTADDPWAGTGINWESFKYVITGYPSPKAGGEWIKGLVPAQISTVVTYFTDDVPRFRGIDLTWYGPFKRGDAILLPTDDAEYWIRKGLASLSPVIETPTIPTETITNIAQNVLNLNTKMESLNAQILTLTAQTQTLVIVIAAEGIAVVALVIALILTLRKHS